jgi:hypothetical protein
MPEPGHPALTGRLSGALFTECAEWVWEQLNDEGYFLSGELVELILLTERELGLQAAPREDSARRLAAEFEARGHSGNPAPITADLVAATLSWEDEFLGLAGIPRSES